MCLGDGTTGRTVKRGRRRPATLDWRGQTRSARRPRRRAPAPRPTEIKAAWRRLARANHPDLTGDDPAASRAATRRMAEINDAYAALTRGRPPARATAATPSAADRSSDAAPPAAAARRARSRPARSPAASTRRDTFRPRNQTIRSPTADAAAGAAPPVSRRSRGERVHGEPPRASTPTGPLERDRVRNFRRPTPPTLDVARDHVIEFGKFHGHTLGQIAAFEPSYIDWVAGTVTRDPELVAAARVVQADLDARGVAPPRPSRRRCAPAAPPRPARRSARKRETAPRIPGGRSMR